MAARRKYVLDGLRVIIQGLAVEGSDRKRGKGQKRKASDKDLGFGNEPKESHGENSTEISAGLKKEVQQKKDEEGSLRTELKSVAVAGDMRDFEQKYKQHKKLVGGVFGGVRISDQQPVAIKYLQRQLMEFVPVHFEDEECNVPLEVLLMSKAAPDQGSIGLNSTVSFLDWFILDQNKIVLVMERPTPSEDLWDYSQKKSPLSEEQIKVVMQQVVDALVDLHSKGVFHRDIKMDNLLVQTTESGPRIRIIDFGCSKLVRQPFKNGAVTFAPPKDDRTECCWASPLSVFQVGNVLYKLLFPKHLDHDFTIQDFMEGNITSLSGLSQECCDFLKACLTIDWEQRISLNQLSHHPWFNL